VTHRRGAGRSAIFLDRDGTLNEKAPLGEYIRHPDELVLLPGAAEAVRRINDAGVPAVLITNQRWLSRPGQDPSAYTAVDARLCHRLAENGAFLDARYTCPHAKDSCACRKPAPGMLLHAAADLDLDLERSVVIGDSATDVQAGEAVRAATILIDPAPGPPMGDHRAHDIREAVDWALRRLLGAWWELTQPSGDTGQ
jgi:D-glycero-D-manno-heptose 1,7-bisphosphate phosphatase